MRLAHPALLRREFHHARLELLARYAVRRVLELRLNPRERCRTYAAASAIATATTASTVVLVVVFLEQVDCFWRAVALYLFDALE